MAHDLFVSYSAADRTPAFSVVEGLESRGIRCWVAPRDIPPGSEYGEEIVEAIKGSRILVLIFSAQANSSPHVRREVERAVSARRAILPFRVAAHVVERQNDDRRPVRSSRQYGYLGAAGAIHSEHALGGAGQCSDMRVERAGKRVEPMRVAQGVFHGARRGDVLDPERENGPSRRDGALDFPPDVRRAVCLAEKISTRMRQLLMASTISSPYSEPAGMSRGATQQRMPRLSSPSTTENAGARSAAE